MPHFPRQFAVVPHFPRQFAVMPHFPRQFAVMPHFPRQFAVMPHFPRQFAVMPGPVSHPHAARHQFGNGYSPAAKRHPATRPRVYRQIRCRSARFARNEAPPPAIQPLLERQPSCGPLPAGANSPSPYPITIIRYYLLTG